MGQIYKCSVCKFESQSKSIFEAHLRRSKHVQLFDTQQTEIVVEPELKEEIPEVIVKKSKKQKAVEPAEELVNESEE